MLHPEATLQAVYGNGFFQILLAVCCSLITLAQAFEFQTIVFFHFSPPFNCSSPILNGFRNVSWLDKASFLNLQAQNQSSMPNYFIPSLQQCWAFVQDIENDTKEGQVFHTFSCDQWIYSDYMMSRTLVTDYDLVCDRRYLIDVMEFGILLGFALGYVASMFTDRFNRRKLIFFYIGWECITVVSVNLAPNLATLFAVRFLRSFSAGVCYLAQCIVAELLPTAKRAVFGTLHWVPYGVGYMLSAGLAYLIRDWYLFHAYGLLILLCYVPVLFILPESPRWLTVNGKHEETITVLRNVASWNRVQLDEAFYADALKSLVELESEEDETVLSSKDNRERSTTGTPAKRDSLLDIIYLPNMRCRCLILVFVHSGIAMCYYGLVLNASYASNDVYLNVFFQGLTEIPSAILGWIMAAYAGRRLSYTVLQLVAGLTGIAAIFLKEVNFMATTVVAVVGRTAASTVFTVSSLYAAEIFPTTVRVMGIFIVLFMGALTATLAPFVNRLSEVTYFLPTLIYGMICTLGSLMVILKLPETKRCPLSQTLGEAERLKQGHEDEWIQEITLKKSFIREDLKML
ncbi:hypothetical protein AAHC03_05559 [Spirometra sp. Aus1]